jgi:hypothetical protein
MANENDLTTINNLRSARKIFDLVKYTSILKKEGRISDEATRITASCLYDIGNNEKALDAMRELQNPSLSDEILYIKCLVGIDNRECVERFQRLVRLSQSDFNKLFLYNSLIEYVAFAERMIFGLPPYHCRNQHDFQFTALASEYEDLCQITINKFKAQVITGRINPQVYSSLCQLLISQRKHFSNSNIIRNFCVSNEKSIWGNIKLEHDDYRYRKQDYQVQSHYTWSQRFKKDNFSHVYLLSCDSAYFKKYTKWLVLSLGSYPASNIGILLHIINPGVDDFLIFEELKHQLGDYLGLIVTRSPQSIQPRIYYHISRFLILPFLLTELECLVTLLDVDTLCHSDPSVLSELMLGHDVGFRARPNRLQPWNQINASVVSCNFTPAGLTYFSRIERYISWVLENKNPHWGLDQLAMFMIFLEMKELKVLFLDEKTVDYDYQSDGIFWQNSGVAKHFISDNEPLLIQSKYRKFYNFQQAIMRSVQ